VVSLIRFQDNTQRLEAGATMEISGNGYRVTIYQGRHFIRDLLMQSRLELETFLMFFPGK
jgi:hypothetical protein